TAERVEGGADPLDHLGDDQVQRGPVESDPGHAAGALEVDKISRCVHISLASLLYSLGSPSAHLAKPLPARLRLHLAKLVPLHLRVDGLSPEVQAASQVHRLEPLL